MYNHFLHTAFPRLFPVGKSFVGGKTPSGLSNQMLVFQFGLQMLREQVNRTGQAFLCWESICVTDCVMSLVHAATLHFSLFRLLSSRLTCTEGKCWATRHSFLSFFITVVNWASGSWFIYLISFTLFIGIISCLIIYKVFPCLYYYTVCFFLPVLYFMIALW